MKHFAILSSLLIFLASAGCVTNYSSDEQVVNPVVLLALTSEGNASTSIQPEGTGHVITTAAQNTELSFSGYRLFVGGSESEVINAAADSGVVDCGALAFTPNVDQNVIIEVKGSSSVTPSSELASTDDTTTSRLCAMEYLLTSGQYVGIRSLLFKDLTTEDTGISSNVMVVP